MTWLSGTARFTVGLYDLECLFQTQLFYDSMRINTHCPSWCFQRPLMDIVLYVQ